jgi:hypothetical protein
MQLKQLPPWFLLLSFHLLRLGLNLDATLGHRLRSLKEFRFILRCNYLLLMYKLQPTYKI